jgi:hypothetical protein
MVPDPALKTELGNEARRIEEDALYSGKGHYNAVSPWRWMHRIVGVGAAISSTLAAIAVLRQWCPTFAVAAAALSTICAVVLTTLRPSEEADRHQRAGDRYFAIKNRARIFRRIELAAASASEEKLVEAIKQVSDELANIKSGAPVIPRRAYKKAEQEIEVEKTAEYQVDKPSRGQP